MRSIITTGPEGVLESGESEEADEDDDVGPLQSQNPLSLSVHGHRLIRRE